MITATQRRILSATPTLDTNAYAQNDRMGSVMTFEGIGAHGALLESLVVLDKGSQSKGFTLYFFNELPTVASNDNAALDITDAEMEKCIGTLPVVTADYKSVANSSIATFKNLGLPLTGTDGAVFAIMKSDEAVTHAAASNLVLKLGVRCG